MILIHQATLLASRCWPRLKKLLVLHVREPYRHVFAHVDIHLTDLMQTHGEVAAATVQAPTIPHTNMATSAMTVPDSSAGRSARSPAATSSLRASARPPACTAPTPRP